MNTKHGFGDGWKGSSRDVQHKEPELVFHDTVPIQEEELPKAKEKAYHQNQLVLDYFRQRFSMSFTPLEVCNAIEIPMLLTSVRRAISDLTKEGKLIKCQWSESREGAFGKLNRVWKYNRNFINPITPKK